LQIQLHGTHFAKQVNCLGSTEAEAAGKFNVKLNSPLLEKEFAATHRSLWLGSRPRPATGYFFAPNV
jgi:hypothetical protein